MTTAFQNGVEKARSEIANRVTLKNTKTKVATVQGSPVTLAVDSSRFGTVYRVWDIPSVPKHQLPQEGFTSEASAIKAASKIIDRFYGGDDY